MNRLTITGHRRAGPRGLCAGPVDEPEDSREPLPNNSGSLFLNAALLVLVQA
jgi:hypothetical protein